MRGLFDLFLFIIFIASIGFGFYYLVYFLETTLRKIFKKKEVEFVEDKLDKGPTEFPTQFARQVSEIYNKKGGCLTHETNQLEFCIKVIHVLHCEFCQTRLRSIYPDKFEKEEREIIKQQERG